VSNRWGVAADRIPRVNWCSLGARDAMRFPSAVGVVDWPQMQANFKFWQIN
jgi:hypothetical protein